MNRVSIRVVVRIKPDHIVNDGVQALQISPDKRTVLLRKGADVTKFAFDNVFEGTTAQVCNCYTLKN